MSIIANNEVLNLLTKAFNDLGLKGFNNSLGHHDIKVTGEIYNNDYWLHINVPVISNNAITGVANFIYEYEGTLCLSPDKTNPGLYICIPNDVNYYQLLNK